MQVIHRNSSVIHLRRDVSLNGILFLFFRLNHDHKFRNSYTVNGAFSYIHTWIIVCWLNITHVYITSFVLVIHSLKLQLVRPKIVKKKDIKKTEI